ncbi:MAG: hypothetical protein PHQ35_07825 [Phycisphaerae bacterium]|nr:hypothetical protein [Phycisphaerae bacterium]MDD5380070.1 hypothetical protein [Phycisphaerae bacterium]
MKIMNIPRLKITAIALLTLAALAVGYTLWQTTPPEETVPQLPPSKNPPQPLPLYGIAI